MSQNTTSQEPTLNPEFIINDLLNQNRELAKRCAYQTATSQQLQQEAQSFLAYARQVEAERDESNKLLEEANQKLAKLAGPVPVKVTSEEKAEK